MSGGLAAFHVFELVLILVGLGALATGSWLIGGVLVALWLALLPSLISRTRDPE
jgi:hypothetical protein